MIKAVESPGDPTERLTNLNRLYREALMAGVDDPKLRDSSSGGLIPLSLNLRQTLYIHLAHEIATAERSIPDRIEALNSLLTLVTAPEPIGLPEPNERVHRYMHMRAFADSHIRTEIDALETSGQARPLPTAFD